MNKVEWQGVLPVFKPAGMTSHDVVAKARKILQTRRIGHTGTLDPSVTGVLPLCIGRATRIVEYLQDMPKEYEATLTFGIATDTEDMDGEVIDRVDQVTLTISQIQQALEHFRGQIEQIPPMYSAVKKDGKKLYELARDGIVVERAARKVEIYELQLLDSQLDISHPTISFRVLCSKGTYIRTLCVDIGKHLGVPAVMSSLIRTKSGPFHLEQCYSFDQIADHALQKNMTSILVPVEEAISSFKSMIVSDIFKERALQGQKVPFQYILELDLTSLKEEAELIRLYTSNREFIGLYRTDLLLSLLKPEKIFLSR